MTEEGAPTPGPEVDETPDARRRRIEDLAERYLDDLQKGATPSRAALLAAHPDIASDLDRRLTLMEMLRSARRGQPGPPDAEPATGTHVEEARPPGGAGAGDSPPEETAEFGEDPDSEFPEQIGPYRILEILGHGGMGIVYLADQDEPVRRKVALKLIKLGMDTREVIARFRAERQALAMMNHPAVAQIYDAGATPEGRPYFAMEHVPGVSITEYCDRNRLSTRERLALFVRTCQGVHHAHQKGIIHRDLKPSNILVSANGRALPKVIDFGVAKATHRPLLDDSVYTEHDRFIGTFGYMPPEQAESSPYDIDTRADIYSLGVILYELLVGATPLDAKELRAASLTELRRLIREKEPPKPSTRLSTMGDVSTEVAKRRRTSPGTLTRLIRGDLDWITMKAMEKDRTRRYTSVSEFLADVERHLRGEPVLAGAPSPWYVASKFVRRHRLGTLAAAIIILLTLGSLAGFAVLYLRAEDALVREQEEAERARQLGDFLSDFFTSLDPGWKGPDVPVLEVLADAEADLEARPPESGDVEGEIREILGRAYYSLRRYEESERHLRGALALRETEHGPGSPPTISPTVRLGVCLAAQLRHDEAEPLLRRIAEMPPEILPREHIDSQTAATALARLLGRRGEDEEAEEIFADVLRIQRDTRGDLDRETLQTLNDYGNFLLRGDRIEEAIPLLEQSLEGANEVFGPDHPYTLVVADNLGVCLAKQERWEEAAPIFRHSAETFEERLGRGHTDTLIAYGSVAVAHHELGRLEEAEDVLRENVEICLAEFGERDARTLVFMMDLARYLLRIGAPEEAEKFLKHLMQHAPSTFPREDPRPDQVRGDYGKYLVMLGNHAKAEAQLLRAHEALEKRLGPEHSITRRVVGYLVDLYEAWERPEELERWRRQPGGE